jgi:hypothetical protein
VKRTQRPSVLAVAQDARTVVRSCGLFLKEVLGPRLQSAGGCKLKRHLSFALKCLILAHEGQRPFPCSVAVGGVHMAIGQEAPTVSAAQVVQEDMEEVLLGLTCFYSGRC